MRTRFTVGRSVAGDGSWPCLSPKKERPAYLQYAGRSL